jgi:hypothetical protein
MILFRKPASTFRDHARQALMENIVYDAWGQLVSGSFMDYAMPRADNFCSFALAENEVPTGTNPLGVRLDAGDAGEGVAGDKGGGGGRECEVTEPASSNIPLRSELSFDPSAAIEDRGRHFRSAQRRKSLRRPSEPPAHLLLAEPAITSAIRPCTFGS